MIATLQLRESLKRRMIATLQLKKSLKCRMIATFLTPEMEMCPANSLEGTNLLPCWLWCARVLSDPRRNSHSRLHAAPSARCCPDNLPPRLRLFLSPLGRGPRPSSPCSWRARCSCSRSQRTQRVAAPCQSQLQASPRRRRPSPGRMTWRLSRSVGRTMRLSRRRPPSRRAPSGRCRVGARTWSL